ncbi:NAD-dependent epimerase [Pseudomonas sp. 2FE]|uniref:NAD-dependent epimerase n=1 Tax=Pseudomonas sp. 2FE TaxID=2502190 RepID=UPI0010F8C908|nr:NAD-dependent epimerase [Pseudomonas sp. 2FE]
MKFLVTGAAGFIGFHTARRLCLAGHEVVGIDNLNEYYSVDLKLARLSQLEVHTNFKFEKIDIADRESIQILFKEHKFERVIHLAAQAGVRYSLENPEVYADSNLTGFLNILEGCRHSEVAHLVYASSSSVYGMNAKLPFSTSDAVDHPVSLYAATKRANELMAHTYSHLYGLPTTGLRFFTVYGPWGRPDMAPFKFTKSILGGQPIDIYNNGEMSRDFTYIDDVVEGLARIQDCLPPTHEVSMDGSQGAQVAPAKIYNLGLGSPVRLLDFVSCIEAATGIEAIKNFMPMQPGDVVRTWADVSEFSQRVNFQPSTTLSVGVKNFVEWYRGFYEV